MLMMSITPKIRRQPGGHQGIDAAGQHAVDDGLRRSALDDNAQPPQAGFG